ncbi:MAG: 3-dehydroquinate synthase family protein [Acidimicrobiales bacterium]
MKVTVELADRPYDVVIGAGVRKELRTVLARHCDGYQASVIITSASLRAMSWFDESFDDATHVIEVPEGEDAKTLRTLEMVCEELASRNVSRADVVVGVGGGALTDLAGFAAATYLRGVRLVQVPTTLVGQVDAAIGGKTAVNLRAGKNLVGAFHQPVAVLCDYETLATLPERERRSGLGEVAKCWLLEGHAARDLSRTSLEELIFLSVKLKATIVGADEFESGARALLNYGHTLAHALEALTLQRDRDELRHGEAVAIGLGFAARLAHALGRVDASVIVNHDDVITTLGLRVGIPPELATQDIVDAMGHDKKAEHDLTFVLAGDNGFEVVHNVDPKVVARVLEEFRGDQ